MPATKTTATTRQAATATSTTPPPLGTTGAPDTDALAALDAAFEARVQ